MTTQEFYEYIYKTYFEIPLTAQLKNQADTLSYLKMEIGKLRKQINSLSQKNKEDFNNGRICK